MKNKNPFSGICLNSSDSLEFSKDRTVKYFKCIKEDLTSRVRYWHTLFIVGRIYEAKNQLVGGFFSSYKGYYVKTSSKSMPCILINGWHMHEYFEEMKGEL